AIVQKSNRCFNTDITIDIVAITAGAQVGLFCIISAYVGHGDEVIMFDPIFYTYAGVSKFNQGKCVILKLLPNCKIDINV
ncbi:aminotransferase, partial [Francisella tularensis subsp. holarctica]|nr:aminotransferase [Francisella tularensis subsp. holarctica]